MKSNDLFDLVRSLGRSEKRFFKLNASLHRGERNSLKLFQAIEAMKEYDEKALRAHFRKEKFQGYFSRAKNELYHSILRSMNDYRRQASADLKLKDMLNGIRFLYDKGLYAQALEHSLKAKKAALKNKNATGLLEILQWQKKLLKKKFSAVPAAAIYKEECSALESLAGTNHYWNIHEQVTSHKREKGRFRNSAEAKELRKLLDSIPLREMDGKSWEGKHYALRSHFSFYDQKGDWKHAIPYSEKILAHFESEPAKAEEYMEEFLGTYYNYLNQHMFLKKFDPGFHQHFRAFRELPSRFFTGSSVPLHLRVKYYTMFYQVQMNLFMTKAEYADGEKLIPEMNRHQEENIRYITREERLVTFINFSIVCFARENYSAALGWLNRILNDPSPDLRSDVYSFARVFNLILHYELKHFDYLEYQMRSTYRFLNRKNLFYKLENRIFSFIKKSLSLSSGKELQTELYKLKASLKEMAVNPEEKAVFSSFDFLAWVEKSLLKHEWE